MKAIFTKFHGATATKPSRVSASDSDGNKVVISTDSIEEGSAFAQHENAHRAAAIALVSKMKWHGEWIEGGRNKHGDRVFVSMPIAQTNALVQLSNELSKHWADLPIEICDAWEHFENVVPDGEFRSKLRGDK